MVGTWLGEIRSCSCLPVLPHSAWVLLDKIYQPFSTSLYVITLWKQLAISTYAIIAPQVGVADHDAVAEGKKSDNWRHHQPRSFLICRPIIASESRYALLPTYFRL